jgi:hypothetical protein
MRSLVIATAITASLAVATTVIAKPPQWDTVKTSGRFKVLKAFKKEVVLAAETGLVWTISPGRSVLAACFQN